MQPLRWVVCQPRSIASGVGAYRDQRRGAVPTKSSPTGPAEHDEGGSLSMKCQRHGFCMVVVVWPRILTPLLDSCASWNTARLRADGVLMFAADAPLRSNSSSSSKHPTLHRARRWTARARGDDDGQGDNGRDDIPAEVGKFLVDSLQRHFVWVVEVVGCGGWESSRVVGLGG